MIFSAWVNNVSTYNRIYGSISSILILMLLVYFNSLVLLIGFELNVSINSLRAVALRRQRFRPPGTNDSLNSIDNQLPPGTTFEKISS